MKGHYFSHFLRSDRSGLTLRIHEWGAHGKSGEKETDRGCYIVRNKIVLEAVYLSKSIAIVKAFNVKLARTFAVCQPVVPSL